jgi:hypothetical protein
MLNAIFITPIERKKLIQRILSSEDRSAGKSDSNNLIMGQI